MATTSFKQVEKGKQQTGKAGECSKDSSVKGDNIMIRYERLQRLRWGEVYHLVKHMIVWKHITIWAQEHSECGCKWLRCVVIDVLDSVPTFWESGCKMNKPLKAIRSYCVASAVWFNQIKQINEYFLWSDVPLLTSSRRMVKKEKVFCIKNPIFLDEIHLTCQSQTVKPHITIR